MSIPAKHSVIESLDALFHQALAQHASDIHFECKAQQYRVLFALTACCDITLPLARRCRSLVTLLAAGVPIIDAFQAVASITGHLLFEKATQSVHHQLMNGKSLTQALGPFEALFSALLLQMCSIGEESGTLDQMLEKMAELCERDVDLTVARLTTKLEPAVLLVLGGLLGGSVLALYGPLFQLGQVL